jgi:CTD small phosphatase-like protein 2
VKGSVTHRLYRQHTVPVFSNHNKQTNQWTSTQYVKDLDRIGRDIKRMIIIDNLKENFCWQKQNGIHIRSWYDDPQDTQLYQLVPLLKSIVTDGFTDVR